MRLCKSSWLRASVTLVSFLTLCQLGPAPIRADRYNLAPHTNLQKQDEKTLESEQHPVTMGPVGAAVTPKAQQQMTDQAGSSDASSVFAAANRGSKTQSDSAGQVLGAASQRMQPEGESHTWIWALLLAGGVLGGVFGVKRWADNNIPGAPTAAPQKRESW